MNNAHPASYFYRYYRGGLNAQRRVLGQCRHRAPFLFTKAIVINVFFIFIRYRDFFIDFPNFRLHIVLCMTNRSIVLSPNTVLITC